MQTSQARDDDMPEFVRAPLVKKIYRISDRYRTTDNGRISYRKNTAVSTERAAILTQRLSVKCSIIMSCLRLL